MRALMLTATGLSLVMAATSVAQTRPITDPVTVLKTKPGSDYFLANYKQVTEWLQRVAQESDRMKLVSIGKTAEGREQYMAIISSPENIRNIDKYRGISQQLALAKGLTDDQAKALAADGKAVVWIDAGLHATEVVNAQSHVQLIHEMLTGTDAETMRILNDTVGLYVFANPDGLDLVANWYMRPTDKTKRNTNSIPVLYQKYIGHDNNRDSYASTQPETTNLNRAAYREWFPQILYNQHQTGPVGTVVFIPPFRDPYNFNNEPLVINQTDAVGTAMHARLIAKGMGGSVSRSGAPYSTWFNGGVRTIGYFHNQIGILTEIIGSPTPMEIPLVPSKQIGTQDAAMTIAPQKWHFQQSIDYVKEMSKSILDYASRNREVVLYNRYIMGSNQIQKGSEDSWVITPKRIDAVKAAAEAMKKPGEGSALDDLAGYNTRDIVPSSLYKTVLQDPKHRAPRAFVIPADRQADMPTTVAFLNSLIKTGIEVEQAPSAFSYGGKRYPAGSYVVRSDQAFRPHVLDMFEPQDHPQDFAYPGGPPIRPYDITGYTLAYQMNVTFDRLLDGAPAHFPQVPDVIETPPAGRVIGSGSGGYVVSHAVNNGFILTNRLLKAGAPVFWIKQGITVGGETLAPGALWIPAGGAAKGIVDTAVQTLGIDALAVAAKPAGDAVKLKPVRIALVDHYGGSMASGWNRWIFEKYEFPYSVVYPQELDKGGLDKKYDVIVFQSDVLGREGRPPQRQPDPADLPAEWRMALGHVTTEKTVPQLTAFTKAGGTVIAVGNATRLGAEMGLPVYNALTSVDAAGKRTPLPGTKFYVPGSVLQAKVDPTDPLAYGVPATLDVFYNNNPTYSFTPGQAGVRRVAWFASEDPLRSGWAWGQKALNDTATVIDGSLGKGHVYLLANEVTQRGQPYASFKFLFNAALYGPTQVGMTTSADN
ncbi:M14 family metallopeptidase [Sphingomonas radiodurans]|uniref:M14 family metallopeptidase n=1 Tax=Sphingomonas radiodurans TaxID=2890321 RepID=UPI001E3D9454|nr:M14 metallopeptidase family protein [Sphingomonas radiodurans]WBH18173.1 M14 family metallopeptidase [Sphingomonas radiodurans]